MITYFKDKNNKSKKKDKKSEKVTTILKPFDTIVFIATTSSSSTLGLTGIGLIVIPITTASACALSVGNKVFYEIIMQKSSKYKKLYERDLQTIKSFDKLYKISLEDIIIDKNE